MLRLVSLAFVATSLALSQTPQSALSAVPIESIGSVDTQTATVSGDLVVVAGRAMLVGASTVVARDNTAEITLERGGLVRVCATSGLHLTHAQPPTNQHGTADAQPLMLALDRGAIEVKTSALANDIVMTPDLRFAVRSAGVLDLSLRVTKNGDTCVENHGTAAPILGITDQFGEATYELRPDQHVLFEHGSLKEVVDHETSPCGCPAPPQPGMSIADALLSAPTHEATPSTEAAAQHPFPTAVSQGLAPAPPIPQAPAGVAHAQVATTLGYTADGAGTISGTPAPSSSLTPPPNPPALPPSSPPAGFAHRVGHFFKRLFGGS